MRVVQPSGVGTVSSHYATLAVEPFSGNLLFSWADANDLMVTQCY